MTARAASTSTSKKASAKKSPTKRRSVAEDPGDEDPGDLIASGRRFVYFIPADSLIEGKGYRVHVVFENHPKFFASGDWPYDGKPGQTAPWFWGPDYKAACAIADEENEKKLGYSKVEATKIVASSIAAANSGKRGR